MDWTIQAAQLILSLAILVVLHELGHFIPAKLFKTRVEKFYLFFDPYFSLFKFKKGGTEYGIGWVPLGGYVKIAGMIDESMDREQMKKPAEPWEFRSKPTWQRLIIMLGGVTVNALLAIAIYIMIAFVWGNTYIPNDGLSHGIYCDSATQSIGFENGDKIISLDGRSFEKFSDVRKEFIINTPSVVEVERGESRTEVEIPQSFVAYILGGEKVGFIEPALLPLVDSVLPGTGAFEAGLQKGDQIIKINGQDIAYHQDALKMIESNPNEELNIEVARGLYNENLVAQVSPEGKLGFIVQAEKQIDLKLEEYNVITAIPAGINTGIQSFEDYFKQLKLIFNPETKAYKSVGSFIMIGNAFSKDWDWLRFWNMTALLSVILAIMNLLPIPALDGGHVMFLLYEMFTGRKPHDKVLEVGQIIGMVLLLGLMVLAFSNDIIKYLL